MPDRSTPDDELELLAKWRDGDDAAGDVLFGRYYPAIRALFQRTCPTDVEDLSQETFLAVRQGRERIRSTSFRNYLFGTAHNKLREHLRRKHTERFDSAHMSVADMNPGLSSMLAASDQKRMLESALQRIPLDDQIVLELRFWQGMSGPAIAEVLGLPEGTIRSRLSRAMRKLELLITGDDE
jgi:RNA polymerase sigma-70 factor, ECF subfamily